MHKRKFAFTEKEFKQVKVLLDAGIKQNEVARILSMSPASVGNLKKQSTWEGYVLRKKELAEEIKNKKKPFVFDDPSLGTFKTTATGTVLKPEPKQEPVNQFEVKLLNILTEIEQDLDNLNQNITSKQVDETKKKSWSSRW